MPIVSIVNTKGGVGKSTTALILAQVFAQNGTSTSVLDSDPNQPLVAWQEKTADQPENLTIVGDLTEENIMDAIEAAEQRSKLVIVDVEGSANMKASYAMGLSDFVLIPSRGSQMDVEQSIRVLKFVERTSKQTNRKIPYALLFTCTSALRGRDFRHLQIQLENGDIPVFESEMVERAAFRAIMQVGGTIYQLTKNDVSKPENAIVNAEAVAEELAALLKRKAVAA
jgi:chromosome partitioning protein